MAEGAHRCELPVNSAPHTKNSDINAPGIQFSVSNKEEGTSLPALARAGIIRISRSFPSRIRAFGGGEAPLNNRLMPA